MKKIILKSITMRNWRGEKERTTNFNVDAPTFIIGGNGLGKSRHFNAFCWLLFGKDSEDRKDFEVRSYDTNHNLLHHCECSVEAKLIIDGEELTIKREYSEQWTKPRGQVEEVFGGNVTLCTWNGTPVKVTEYQSRVSEHIIDDTLFKMLTNPKYFTETMHWKEQREVLLQMAGVKSDAEIASDNEDFKKLLDVLSGKSLSDYRKEVAAEKKRLKTELNEVGPRIDQTQKMMPEAEDWEAIEAQYAEVDKQIEELTRQLVDAASLDEARIKEKQEITHKIALSKAKLQELQDMQQLKSEKLAGEANAVRRAIEGKLKTANEELSTLTIDRNRANERLTHLNKEITNITQQLDVLRSEWHKINSRIYNGEDTCPHCGQRLPEDRLQEMRTIFDNKRRADLEANNERGIEFKRRLDDYSEELFNKTDETERLSKAVINKQSEIDNLYKQLSNTPEKTASDFAFARTEEMEAVGQQIATLETKLKDADNKGDDDILKDIERRRDTLADERTALQARLQKRTQITEAEKEITRLEEVGRELSQKIADVEQREYVAAEFTKKKVEDCEKRINNMFETVNFQLFDYTQDGTAFECCTVLVGGVPYGAANSAGKVNAGLDIIRSLCKFNNVTAPIFCDGSESVNDYIAMDSQMIFLKVTTDKELIIK